VSSGWSDDPAAWCPNGHAMPPGIDVCPVCGGPPAGVHRPYTPPPPHFSQPEGPPPPGPDSYPPAPGRYAEQPGSPPPWPGPGQPSYGQPPYGQPPYPQPSHQPSYGQPPYGPPPGYPYGQPGYAYGPYGYIGPPPNNGLAIASFILGLVWAFWLGSLLAIIFGHIAIHQIGQRRERGRGFAIAGLVLGYLGAATFVFFLILGAATSGTGGTSG
jgi:hypothetical protein